MKIALPEYEKANVLVVGDVMLDRYWHGPVARISPEAPVPIVNVKKIEDRPGGAANVALNIASDGRVSLGNYVSGHTGSPNLLVDANGTICKTSWAGYSVQEVDKRLAIKDKLIEKLSARLDAIEKKVK